jgi:hypothetical protein
MSKRQIRMARAKTRPGLAAGALAATAQQNDGGAGDPVGPVKADLSPPCSGQANAADRRKEGESKDNRRSVLLSLNGGQV